MAWRFRSTTTVGTAVISGGSGCFTVDGTHIWAAPGSFTVTVVVTDNFGETATIQSAAGVASNPITATGAKLILRQNVASTVEVAHFTLFDLGAAAGDFSATIDWGDGAAVVARIISPALGHF